MTNEHVYTCFWEEKNPCRVILCRQEAMCYHQTDTDAVLLNIFKFSQVWQDTQQFYTCMDNWSLVALEHANTIAQVFSRSGN